ncbi:hypothetical protein D6C89_00239 [Aureobasidium pullulans]|nr:hypothetical protein D6C89_00239 [Aureobasidium pullulans]
MLPNFLQSTYSTYKRDTDAIANWLATTAREYGYSPQVLEDDKTTVQPLLESQSVCQPSVQAPSTRLKGKARKLAREAASAAANSLPTASRVYTIPIKSFTILASEIVSRKKSSVSIPAVLGKTLNRAIAFRKDHNDWFSRNEDKDTSSANESHAHFISVLERVRQILAPHMATGVAHEAVKRSFKDMGLKKSTEPRTNNLFEDLEVEESSEEFLDAPVSENVASSTTKTGGNIRYQAERLSKAEEKVIAQSCLLEAVADIRAFIKGLWQRYRDREQMDLMAAAVTTNTAIEMVRMLHEDYAKSFPDDAEYIDIIKKPYDWLFTQVGEGAYELEPSDEKVDAALYAKGDEIFMTTHLILETLRNSMYTKPQLPVIDVALLNHGDTSKEWSMRSSEDKHLDDEVVLSKAWTGLVILAHMKDIVKDDLTEGVRALTMNEKVPFWLTVAAQIFLDVKHVLGPEVERPFEEMQKGARYMKSSIGQTIAFHQKLPPNPRFDPGEKTKLPHIAKVNELLLLGDLVDEALSAEGIDMKTRDEYRNFGKQHPILCGVWLFSIRHKMQQVSIDFARLWSTTVYCAHIYNAVRVEGLVTSGWEDMEVLCTLQDQNNLFMGTYPETLVECVNRSNTCMGCSPLMSARNQRRPGPIHNLSGMRTLKYAFPISDLFFGRLGISRNSLPTNLSLVEEKIEAQYPRSVTKKSFVFYKDNHPTKLARGRPSQSSNAVNKKKLDSINFLSGLATALHNEGVHLTFDYLRLHRTCCEVLQDMVGEIEDEAGRSLQEAMFAPDFFDRDKLLWEPDFVTFLLALVSQVHMKRMPKDNRNKARRALAKAAKCIEDKTKGKAGSIGIEVVRKGFGYEWDWDSR